jgi:KDO2-lipid IV(A) lauroyltransferase
MVYEDPVELPSASAADPVRELTQRCSDVLERYVRRQPELWLWMHRRWRGNGESGDATPGMFPAGADETASGEEP